TGFLGIGSTATPPAAPINIVGANSNGSSTQEIQRYESAYGSGAGANGIGVSSTVWLETTTNGTSREASKKKTVFGHPVDTSKDSSIRFYTQGPDSNGATSATEKMRIGSSTGLLVTPRSTETIASGGTITANSCGTIKAIDAGSSITTDTTDTFTAPGA